METPGVTDEQERELLAMGFHPNYPRDDPRSAFVHRYPRNDFPVQEWFLWGPTYPGYGRTGVWVAETGVSTTELLAKHGGFEFPDVMSAACFVKVEASNV